MRWTLWRFRDFLLLTRIPSRDKNFSGENDQDACFKASSKELQSFRHLHPHSVVKVSAGNRQNLSRLFNFTKKRHRNVFFKWFSETLLILNKYYSMAVYHKHIMIFILKPKKDKLRILFIWSSSFPRKWWGNSLRSKGQYLVKKFVIGDSWQRETLKLFIELKKKLFSALKS